MNKRWIRADKSCSAQHSPPAANVFSIEPISFVSSSYLIFLPIWRIPFRPGVETVISFSVPRHPPSSALSGFTSFPNMITVLDPYRLCLGSKNRCVTENLSGFKYAQELHQLPIYKRHFYTVTWLQTCMIWCNIFSSNSRLCILQYLRGICTF